MVRKLFGTFCPIFSKLPFFLLYLKMLLYRQELEDSAGSFHNHPAGLWPVCRSVTQLHLKQML